MAALVEGADQERIPSWTPSAQGDKGLAAQALEETGAASAFSRVGLSTYLSDLSQRIKDAVRAWLEEVFANSEGLRGAIAFGAQALVIIGILALVIWLITVLFRLWEERGRRVSASGEESFEALSVTPLGSQVDAAAWRARLAELLAEGKIDEALEAMWWWLARSLAGAEADPSWTSRELVKRFRRHDLLSLVRRLDVFQYGPRRPDRSQVERLAQDLAKAVP